MGGIVEVEGGDTDLVESEMVVGLDAATAAEEAAEAETAAGEEEEEEDVDKLEGRINLEDSEIFCGDGFYKAVVAVHPTRLLRHDSFPPFGHEERGGDQEVLENDVDSDPETEEYTYTYIEIPVYEAKEVAAEVVHDCQVAEVVDAEGRAGGGGGGESSECVAVISTARTDEFLIKDHNSREMTSHVKKEGDQFKSCLQSSLPLTAAKRKRSRGPGGRRRRRGRR